MGGGTLWLLTCCICALPGPDGPGPTLGVGAPWDGRGNTRAQGEGYSFPRKILEHGFRGMPSCRRAGQECVFSGAKCGVMCSFTGGGERPAVGGRGCWVDSPRSDRCLWQEAGKSSVSCWGWPWTDRLVRGKLCPQTEIVFANNLFNTGSLQEL